MNEIIKSKFRIYEAGLSDDPYLWEWRNDPLTVEMSKTQKKVKWLEHKYWLENIRKQCNTKIYIAKNLDLKRIGMSRFQENKEKEVEVSINICPKIRGKGFSYDFLRLSVKKYLDYNKSILIATIRKENNASIKCFSKCGFDLVSEDNQFYFYKKK